ncbi:hypothetical protein [Bacteroides togonis]|uniref:hypothetical protein n=1 Tax=Bacteroides togonis TaxID=1917883 RepID=UPI0013563710|nr:hypothetical protein [Bacteroides togonis]
MPIIIKEIQVSTVVEKKIILPEEISPKTLELVKRAVLEELSEMEEPGHTTDIRKRER